ncbi:hypothetical protein ACC754_40515, partial [Rhizobium johnstonii]
GIVLLADDDQRPVEIVPMGAARAMMVLVMLGLLVTIHATALPLYVAFDRAALLNSYAALVEPFTISVFAIFMFMQFFRAMPDDLI